MIQTSLFNYFNCTGLTKQTENKVQSFKQTNLTDYFKVIPKKKNMILNYFTPPIKKRKQDKQEKEKVFELILVDIKDTAENSNDIICVKKNMYEEGLKYIAISYRWGEVEEQPIKTPDYLTHITSFDKWDLILLCWCINYEQDLKKIPYLWIDAISVDQYAHNKKKEIILKMDEIYKNATYILAVPDLHWHYLYNNPAMKDAIYLVKKYKELIYERIYNHDHSMLTIKDINENIRKRYNSVNGSDDDDGDDNDGDDDDGDDDDGDDDDGDYFYSTPLFGKQKKVKIDDEELKKAYRFLAYLIDDWSNRAWVISEYHIAKEKYKQQGTPLKYIFLSLLEFGKNYVHFFSYYFGNGNNNNSKDNYKLSHGSVDDHIKLIQFLKQRVSERQHLDMLLNSNASRNEDRFNAILPSWDKYRHFIKNKNTVSEWNITDTISVRLKLYELMDDDLWDKARLLFACSQFDFSYNFSFPSFASRCNGGWIVLIEKDCIEIAFKEYTQLILSMNRTSKKEWSRIAQHFCDCKTKFGVSSIYTENLIDIQLNHDRRCRRPYLSVKSNICFISKLIDSLHYETAISAYSPLKDDDDDGNDLFVVFLPYFTYKMPDYIQIPPILGTAIGLLGNIDKNKWILFKQNYILNKLTSEHFYSNDYTFNIY